MIFSDNKKFPFTAIVCGLWRFHCKLSTIEIKKYFIECVWKDFPGHILLG